MQDDIIMNETEYLEGFNMGYKLAKEFPEFAEFLANARGQIDKLEGMKDGRSQYLDEQLEKNMLKTKEVEVKANLPWLDRSKPKNRNNLRDKDKNIEPEH